jgi:exodeoxyribonuclease VII large subunit
MSEQNSISVSQLTRFIRGILEETFEGVRVTGEISNFKQHSSGHRYFTLKDEGAQIACTMWRTRQLGFLPADGMKVVIFGNISVYPPQGKYQIDCVSMMPLGKGDLHQAFELLKEKLLKKGYFDAERKRPLPHFPLKIGVITSPTGAAVRDILSTLERRMPACEVLFRPALVQGDGAAEDIAEAIYQLNELDCDAIICGRGGGSLEDLWAFNTEIVAEAIFHSRVPVISAVGHETDVTIADFVADVRAATPTAAAELVTPRTMHQYLQIFDSTASMLTRRVEMAVRDAQYLVEDFAGSSVFKRLESKLREQISGLNSAEVHLDKSLHRVLKDKKNVLFSLQSRARSIHPLLPLQRGFALLKSGGKIVKNSESLAGFKNIEIVRHNETAIAGIEKVFKNNDNDV